MRKLIFFLLVALLLTSCNMSFDSQGKAHIICIGVEYGYVGGPPVLDGCIDDALEVGLCLTKQITNTGVVADTRYLLCRGVDPDEQSAAYPSPTHVLDTIASLQVNKDDLIVFYYSGHGVNEAGAALALPPEEEGGYYAPLDMKTLFGALAEKGCQTVILADCCYSGGLAVNQSAGTFKDGLTAFMRDAWQPSVAVIASCKENEESTVSYAQTIDGAKQKHGYLTIGLLENLGWTHANAKTETVLSGSDSYKVKGYVSDYLTKLDVATLKENLKKSWAANYTIQFNDTRSGIYLIP